MVLTIATDCSGIEAPIEALIQMKIDYIQKWSCEIDKYAVMSQESNYKKAEKVYTDMLKRKSQELPHVDLYVCGFPCQAFSNMGRRLGTSDPRAKIIPKMIQTIKYSRPKVCILENVRGFLNIEKGVPYKNLLSDLKRLGYEVYHDLYNTKDYGLPQNRVRVYFICIRKDIQKKKYTKPLPVKMKPFERILDNTIIQKGAIPDMYKKNLHKLKEKTKIISPYNYYSPVENASPTLLTDCSMLYIVKQNRYISIKEALRLQGFRPTFKQVVSRNQIMKQIGNSMSVNVLKKIIYKVLESIK